MQLHTHRNLISIIGLLLFAITLQAQETKPPVTPQKIVEQVIAIEFTAEPLVQKATTIRAAEDVNIKWKVTNYIDTGIKPKRITIQPDQQYLWVTTEGNEMDGGVTIIDPVNLKVAAKIATGAGRHDIVISNDNRFAFVSNRDSGTVSMIDIRKLEKLDDVKVGPGPVSMALSDLSKALYVTSEIEGTVTVIGQQNHEVLARMKTKPGARFIRFAPAGRYGFVLNTKESIVNIFDAASNRMLHEVNVGKSPDQIMFSDTFADATRRVSGFEENENVYTANSIQSLHARHNDGHCN